MKRYSVKLMCAFLSVILVISVMTSVSFFAADTDTAAPAVEAAAGDAAYDGEIADPASKEIAAVAVDPEPEEASEEPSEEPEESEPTVGKVQNLERNSYESDSCQLDWDPVEGADGYYVYYLNADDHKNFSKYADVTTNSCLVKPLKQGTQYHFKVSAYVIYKDTIIEGEPTLKKTATQPAKVTGLTKWRSSNVLEMEWNRNTRATGYRIYRTEGSGKEVLYKTVKGNTNTSFTDTNVKEGKTYKYRVKSYRDLYNTSYSSEAGVITFIAGLCGPNYTIVSRCQRVNLTWNANPYATHYEVYYSTSPDNSSFELLYTTPRLYYNSTKLTNGKTYYFRVRPIYKSGGTTITGTSNKKSVKVTNTAYGDSTGSTYIEISIDQQHMWVYKSGKQIASTDVVTGNKGSSDTPKGYYSVVSKARGVTLSGAGYSSYVEYWMAFIGSSYGIHDASWRSEFGNPIYKGNGSHGCVNTPYSAVKTIYNNISVGTPVIIY